jgi:aminotransferase in exopolysaccharide biosynthesis
MFEQTVNFIKSLYGNKSFIPLHEPRFIGNEKKYLEECIDSTFVSSVGTFVDRFENMTAAYTGASNAVVCVNGTEALFMALKLAGVHEGDEVITQSLTFIATANAITHTGAQPVFIDVDRHTMGMSPAALQSFLEEFTEVRDDGYSWNKSTGRRIIAAVPMHTFGHPVNIREIVRICSQRYIQVVEDAAESIGSLVEGKHTGTFGKLGILSFNGNKIITTGGGGMILTDDPELGQRAKHLTTQAKQPHPWEFIHDDTGYNMRMPNINAALGVAQLEQMDGFLERKRRLAETYAAFFKQIGIPFFLEPSGARSNYWLNVIFLENREERDRFLTYTNNNGVMTRPIWRMMNKLPMYTKCQTGPLLNSCWFEDHAVNIPSSVIL